MLALSERERRFVWAYMLNAMTDGRENGSQAARDAGYSDIKGGCRVRAHGLLHRDSVLDAMNEVAGRELRGMAIPAVVALGKLLGKADHADHRKSIEMVLDRVGHGARTTIDVQHSGEVNVNHTDAALADLRKLKLLGVPRAELEKTFGFSGLTRYERMLEIADQAGPKVIEHDRGEVLKNDE